MQARNNMQTAACITVTGWSMAPALRPGDRVLLADGALRVGDVVVVTAPQRLLVHRVVAFVAARDGSEPGFVITRGDGVRHCDAPSPLASVLGRVVAVERNGRRRPVPERLRTPRWLVRMAVRWQQKQQRHRWK